MNKDTTHSAMQSTKAALLLGMPLVFLGGVLGSSLRYLIDLAIPEPANFPLGILIVNLTGAFALALLIELLAHSQFASKRQQQLRLLLGTGLLGGFTTFSAVALDGAALISTGEATPALIYLALSLIGGVLAAASGIWIARKIANNHQTQQHETPEVQS